MKDTANDSGEIYLNGQCINAIQISDAWERDDILIIIKHGDVISANSISKQYSMVVGYYKMTGSLFKLIIKYNV